MLAFTNIGQADERHLVTASRDRLPESVRSLPNGSHLAVTFATGSVSTMALNWGECSNIRSLSLLGTRPEPTLSKFDPARPPEQERTRKLSRRSSLPVRSAGVCSLGRECIRGGGREGVVG